jgi:two-component system NtrC family sensor kinase
MRNIHILLVDDENNYRQTLSKRLMKRGFVVDQSASGNECLSLLKEKKVDVVILDIKMPGMGGLDVLRHIKNRFPKTEVILLTGHATTDTGVEGIKSGAFDYLSKPIELDHLVNKIDQAHAKILRLDAEQKEREYRKRIEQQMIATERLASLGTLAAGVAHEINNPLAIISESVGWMGQLLAKEELKDIPHKQNFEMALGRVVKSVNRSKKITHQLLGFVRKSDSLLSEVDLNDLIDESIQLIELELKKRDIKIIKEIDPSQEKILSDPFQIRQVLVNLLTNAVHAIGSEGSITISLKNFEDQIVITVKDSGVGIPGENMEKIFEPFFSTKPPGEGTGLGLFVTRGIIEKLGGSVEVESKVGDGSLFIIRLPKQPKNVDKLMKNEVEDWIEKTVSHLKEADKKENELS